MGVTEQSAPGGPAPSPVVLATDGIGLIGTLGFFLPAALLVLLVAIIIIRDRRSADDDETPAA